MTRRRARVRPGDRRSSFAGDESKPLAEAGAGAAVRGVRGLVCLGLLAAFLIAPRLWFGSPFLAPLPPFDWLPAVPPALDYVFYGGLIFLLPAIALSRRPRGLIAAWCVLFGLRAALDLIVWQPYFFQYGAMLLASSFVMPARRDGEDADAALDANRLIVFCVYLWSGLNKLNHTFLTAGLDAVPGLATLLSPLAAWMDPTALGRLSVAMPFVESAIGIGLLAGRTRRIAAAGAIAMHVLILLSIGPFGENHNPVVWPWNVAMIGFVWLLFLRGGEAPARRIIWGRGSSLHRALLVLFAVCPLLSLLGWWPSSLSFRLYTFRLYTADIYVTEALRERLPAGTRAELEPLSVFFSLEPAGGGEARRVGPYVGGLNVSDWSERELHAFIPPEPSAFRRVFANFCALAHEPSDALLLLVAPPDVLSGATRRSVSVCGDSPS